MAARADHDRRRHAHHNVVCIMIGGRLREEHLRTVRNTTSRETPHDVRNLVPAKLRVFPDHCGMGCMNYCERSTAAAKLVDPDRHPNANAVVNAHTVGNSARLDSRPRDVLGRHTSATVVLSAHTAVNQARLDSRPSDVLRRHPNATGVSNAPDDANSVRPGSRPGGVVCRHTSVTAVYNAHTAVNSVRLDSRPGDMLRHHTNATVAFDAHTVVNPVRLASNTPTLHHHYARPFAPGIRRNWLGTMNNHRTVPRIYPCFA